MGVVVSSSHVVSAAPSSLMAGLLTLCPCSTVGSHPWEAVLHELLQHGSFSRGAVLQEQAAPAWIPCGITSPASKPAPAWASLSTGPARRLLQRGLPMGSQTPLGIHLLQCGVLHGLQVDICSTVDLHGLQGDSLPHHGLLHRLQGNLCSGTWSTSSTSFFTGVCRVVSLSYSHSSLCLLLCSRLYFPLLNCVIPEPLPPLLMGLALASGGSVLEPACTGCIRHGGSFKQLLTEAASVVSCYQNLATQTQYRW